MSSIVNVKRGLLKEWMLLNHVKEISSMTRKFALIISFTKHTSVKAADIFKNPFLNPVCRKTYLYKDSEETVRCNPPEITLAALTHSLLKAHESTNRVKRGPPDHHPR